MHFGFYGCLDNAHDQSGGPLSRSPQELLAAAD